jgi:hypothetical protein
MERGDGVSHKVRFWLGSTLAVSGLVLSFVESLLWIRDGKLRRKRASLGLTSLAIGAQLLRRDARP